MARFDQAAVVADEDALCWYASCSESRECLCQGVVVALQVVFRDLGRDAFPTKCFVEHDAAFVSRYQFFEHLLECLPLVCAGALGDRGLYALLDGKNEFRLLKDRCVVFCRQALLCFVEQLLGVGEVDFGEVCSENGHVEFHLHFKAYIAVRFVEWDVDD